MINGMKYKVGMYGGSFNPLHLGHVDCIMKAASLCEELFIVISYSNLRDDVDVKIKYRWIYLLTKHIGNVKIILLEDKVKEKSDYTKKYWEDDCKLVKDKIGKKIDVVFCGSDYDENSFWNVCYKESEFVVFKRNKYNSTEIRKNIYDHWEWLPKVVQPYYVKKVLLIGCESSGKSTLTINLANHYNTNYLEEVGRDLSEISGTDTMMISEDFTRILLEHKAKEMKVIQNSNKVLFEDTDCLITKFFMDFLEDKEVINNTKLAEAIASINRYDLILFLEPDVTWVQDGDRSELIAKNRKKYSDKIKRIYTQYGFDFKCISGDYLERYEKAIEYVDGILAVKRYRKGL